VQIRREHLQKKTDTEPWMTLEKALRNLDTTRQIFLSLSPESDRVPENHRVNGYGLPSSSSVNGSTFSIDCTFGSYCKIAFKSLSETLMFSTTLSKWNCDCRLPCPKKCKISFTFLHIRIKNPINISYIKIIW